VASFAVGRFMPDKLIRVLLVDDSDAFRRSARRYACRTDATYRASGREAGADGFIAKSDFTLRLVDLLRDLAEGDKPPPVDCDSTVPRGHEQS
jgi:hypothetical protein